MLSAKDELEVVVFAVGDKVLRNRTNVLIENHPDLVDNRRIVFQGWTELGPGVGYSRRRISGIMDELDLPRVRKG